MKLTRAALLALAFTIPSVVMVVKAADDKPAAAEATRKEKGAKEDVALQAEGVTVTGRVSNLNDARVHPEFHPYLSAESYLQLFAVPPGGLPGGLEVTATKGLLIYRSDLAKSPISKDGSFRLQASQLKCGSYFIVVQNVQQGGVRSVPFLVKGRSGRPWKVEIPPDAKGPLVIDGGWLWLP